MRTSVCVAVLCVLSVCAVRAQRFDARSARIARARIGEKHDSLGELSFDYDGEIVPADQSGRGVFQAERRRFLLRDAAAEAEAGAKIRQLGFRPGGYYGEPRLESFLLSHHHLVSPGLIDAVREDVLAFCGSARPRDDMTLMLVERA